MKIRHAIVVAKQTALSKIRRSDTEGSVRMKSLMAQGHVSVSGIRPAHEEHLESLAQIRSELRKRRIDFNERKEIKREPKNVDLIISVGGDGMLLHVSHAVRGPTPVLGINSAPSSSVGYLTGCDAGSFGALLDAMTSAKLKPIEVQRLQVKIDGKVIREPVLNDVLFCADNPAVMTRYRLRWAEGQELQRSSGIWISTPAGSTSALSSAGGPILPLPSKQFAFIAREPYSPPGRSTRYRSAVLAKGQKLEIECRILEASVFLDGSHRRYPVPFGKTVTLALHSPPLRLVRETGRTTTAG